MNNEEMFTMDGIVTVTKYLVAVWSICKCLLQLSDIKYGMYKSNGDLRK